MSGITERLAEVLAEHVDQVETRCYPAHDCTCGEWNGAIGDNGSDTDGQHDNADAHRAHLAQALLPVVEREIAAARGEVREQIAQAIEDLADGGISRGSVIRLGALADAARVARAALSPDPDRGEGEGKGFVCGDHMWGVSCVRLPGHEDDHLSDSGATWRHVDPRSLSEKEGGCDE